MDTKSFIKVLLILATIILGWFFYLVEFQLPYESITTTHRFSNETPTNFGLKYEDFSVKNDTVTLRGFYIPKDSAKATIVCIHGRNNNKEFFLPFAKKLHDLGCNVALVDLRGHGKSGGKYSTFGFYEKADIQKVIDYIDTKSSLKNIGIHGHSLGGAVALLTLEADKRLKFGIIESTYSNYEDIMLEFSARSLPFRSRWITHHILSTSASIAQFDLTKVNPIEACRNIKVPIFMEHGTDDKVIPYEMGELNFAALGSNKVFYPIENGSHVNVHQDGGDEYWEAMKGFILKRF
jgi:uncharacterized protein